MAKFPVAGHKDIVAKKAGSGKSEFHNGPIRSASAGRVFVEAKASLKDASNPKGRTSYVAGCKTASTHNTY